MQSEIQNPTLRGEAEMILEDISGHSVSTDRQIDLREIQDKIRATLNEVLKIEVYSKRKEGDRTAVPQYIATYPIEVLEDDDGLFIEIPDMHVNLPNNEGIYSLHRRGKPRDAFILSSNPDVSGEIEAGGFLGKKAFYVEGLRGYFMDEECVKKSSKLTLKLIVAAPNTLKETDRIPLLPEQIAQMRRIVKQDILGVNVPEDTDQDSKDDTNTVRNG